MVKSEDLDTNRTRIGIIFICFNLIFFYAAAATACDELFFSLLIENNLDQILILFLALGGIIGGLLWAKIFRNINNPYFFCFLNILLGFSLLTVGLFLNVWIVIIGYVIMGFLGVTILTGNVAFIKNITNIESRGRYIGLIFTFMGGIFLLSAILSVYIPSSKDLFMIIGGVFMIIGCISVFFNQKYSLVNIKKKEEIFIQDLNNRDITNYNIAIYLVFLVIGLTTWQIIVNPIIHQLAIEGGSLFFGVNANTATAMENTNFVIGLTMVVMAYPAGRLLDRIGRTKGILIGLFIACLGLFSLAFFVNTLTIFMAWFFIGIELSIFFNIAITVFLDIGVKRYKSYIGLPWVSLFAGLGSGHIVGWLTESFTFSDVALVVLVTFPSAIIAIIYAKDSLPSKEEREWRNCITHLFLIAHTDVCLVYHSFQDEKLVDQDLFAGGISGMISLIQELTKSDERIEVFSQKNKKIILQYGKYLTGALLSSKDLKILHQKLKELIYNYEDIFHDYFENWTGELSQFEPGIRFVKRFFT